MHASNKKECSRCLRAYLSIQRRSHEEVYVKLTSSVIASCMKTSMEKVGKEVI